MGVLKWTKEKLKKEALKYKRRSEFKKNSNTAYKIACNIGILQEICSHMPENFNKGKIPHNKKWKSIEDILPFSLQCKTKTEFYKKFPKAYQGAKDLKVLQEACKHMPNDASVGKKPHNFKWTKENITQEALKYKTRTDFFKKRKGAYIAARNLGILDMVCEHMEEPINKPFSLEEIQQEALKYKTRGEFKVNSAGAYAASHRKGVIDKISNHMALSRCVSAIENELVGIIKEKYPKTQKLVDRKVKIENKSHIRGFDIDIYVPELRKGIEFDGEYWHSIEGLKRSREHWPEEDLKNYHQIKDEYFLSKSIEILHIKEEDWITNKQACINKCFEFLGVNNGKLY